METIVIAGGTGLIGTALSKLLISKGYRVIILSRKPKHADGHLLYSAWDPEKFLVDKNIISEADHIIHMAGANVAGKRWTQKRKKIIINSRVNSCKTIVKALTEIPNKVQTVVSASAIGFYGPDANNSSHAFKETDPSYNDFLGSTCKLWEESIEPVKEIGKRLVILRTGIVLSNAGGAYPEFRKPFKAGVAAILGSGKQMISWIHIDDLCRIYLFAVEKIFLAGVYNAVAPEIISNKAFVLKIAKARRRPYLPVHVPEFLLKLFLGEMSIEVLKSTTVNGNKIRNAGFNFLYPSADAAINELERK